MAMPLMISELYEALKLAHAADEKAKVAAEAASDFDRRIGRIEILVSANSAVPAINTALVVAVTGRLFQFF